MVSWVFTSGEDLSRTASVSASKALHRDRPQRSLTSQLEDGTLNEFSQSHSMLAPDLIPHYLGKTPAVVKQRRNSASQRTAPAFRLPKFDASQFKIPELPILEEDDQTRPSHGSQARLQAAPPPREKQFKSLEVSAEYQSKHDEEAMHWLAVQHLEPKDLVSLTNLHDIKVDDYGKLQEIMGDGGFFRRRGLLPPNRMHFTRITTEDDPVMNEDNLSSSHSNVMVPDKSNNDIPSNTLRGRRVTSRNWHTSSSTGILAAWRDICQQEESLAQSESLSIDRPMRSRSRTTSLASVQREPNQWHDDISFSQPETGENLNPVPELDIDVVEAGEKYWAPIRSFPMPPANPDSREKKLDLKRLANHYQSQRHRGHSRQASLARRPRTRPTIDSTKSRSRVPDSRPQTPVSAVSSRVSHSRRPVNANRVRETSQQRALEVESPPPKPRMVDSQVQTGDELMSFLQDGPIREQLATPSISKERRKRPGCFSALDEDMEDIFGPYSDIPVKRTKLDDADDDEVLSRPRLPLLREDEAVKTLRAQQAKERASMPPPILAETEISTVKPASTTILVHDQVNSVVPKVLQPDMNLVSGTSSLATKNNHELGEKAQATSKSSITSLFSGAMNDPPLSNTSSAKAPGLSQKFESSSQKPSFPKFDFGHTPVKEGEVVNAAVESVPEFSFGSTSTSTMPMISTTMKKPSSSSTGPPTDATGQEAAGIGPASAKSGFRFGDSGESAADATNKSLLKGPFNFTSTSTPNVSTITELKTVNSAEQSTKAPPKFVFGAPAKNTSSTIEPEVSQDLPFALASGPKFKSTTIETGAPASGFSFGSPNLTVEKPAVATFSFQGSNAGPGDPSLSANTERAAQDGAADQQQSMVTPSNVPVFSFGASQAANPSSASIFSLDKQNANKDVLPSFGGFTQNSSEKASFPLEAPSQTEDKSSVAVQNKPTAFNFGLATQENKPQSSTPSFSFGATQQPPTPTTVTPIFGNSSGTTPGSFGHQPANLGGTIQPVFGVGQTMASASSTTLPGSGFGTFGNVSMKAESGSSGSIFSNVQTKPETTSLFGSTQPPPSAMPGFGMAASSKDVNQVPPVAFGFPSSAPPVNQNSPFSFGASPANGNAQLGSTSFSGFGAASTLNAAQTQPQQQQQSTGNTPFHFGAAAQGGPSSQPFVFGQSQTAPNSGFASPAVQSPSIPSATVPGSPNPFTFSAAPGNAAGLGPDGKPRRVLQPRSRRAKGGR